MAYYYLNLSYDTITSAQQIYDYISSNITFSDCINNVNSNYPVTYVDVYVRYDDWDHRFSLFFSMSGGSNNLEIHDINDNYYLNLFVADKKKFIRTFDFGFDINPKTRNEEEFQQGIDDLLPPSSQEQQQNFEEWYNDVIEPLMEEYSEYDFAISYGINEDGEFEYNLVLSKTGHDSLNISDSYGYDSTEMKNYVSNYGRQCDYEDWLQDSGIQDFIGSTGKGYEINYGLDENHQFQETIEVWDVDPETGQEIPDSRRELPIYNEGGGEFWVKSSGEHLLTSQSSLIQNPLRLLMRSS